MRVRLTRRTLIAAALASLTTKVAAAPKQYRLVHERSRVSFRFKVNGIAQNGTVPVAKADIRVDTGDLAASSADVTADIRKASTGVVFVTQALLSQTVLDAQNHPMVGFSSTKIRLGARGRISEGATITGNLRLRGITRETTLDAVLSRPAGTAANDLSILYVTLNGTLNRHDFGASGFKEFVADIVELNIRAEIQASG